MSCEGGDILDTISSPFACLLQAGIIEDDIRALSAKLNHSFLSRQSATSECNFLGKRVLRDCLPCHWTISIYDVDDAWREAHLLDKGTKDNNKSGANSEGLRTMVLPVVSTGAILRERTSEVYIPRNNSTHNNSGFVSGISSIVFPLTI